MTDIKRNFEFRYYQGVGHLSANWPLVNKPIKAIEDLGGKKIIHVDIPGRDTVDELVHRQFQFEFFQYEFVADPQSGVLRPITAICTRELYPQTEFPEPQAKDLEDALSNPRPHIITRVKLGNYNNNSSHAQEISGKLSKIPEDAYDKHNIESL